MNLSQWKNSGGSIPDLARRAGISSNRLYATMHGGSARVSIKQAESLAAVEPELDPFAVWKEGSENSNKKPASQ